MSEQETYDLKLNLEQRIALAGYLPQRGTAIDLADIRQLRETFTLTTTEIEALGVETAEQITIQMARDHYKDLSLNDNQWAVIQRIIKAAEQAGDLADCLLEFFQEQIQGA